MIQAMEQNKLCMCNNNIITFFINLQNNYFFIFMNIQI